MPTEENYRDLSRIVYQIDPKHKNYNSNIKEDKNHKKYRFLLQGT